MVVSLRLPVAAALVLVAAGCSTAPTATDKPIDGRSAVESASEAPDSSNTRTGNLFGSGT
jgi:hypothetical protein